MSNTFLGSWLPEPTFWCSSSSGSFATWQNAGLHMHIGHALPHCLIFPFSRS